MTQQHTPQSAGRQRPPESRSDSARGGYEVVLPLLGGLTVVCSSTALAGVITGGNWLGHLFLTVLTTVLLGLVLRALRVPTPLVALGQMAGLACLTTVLFTDSGFAGFIPGSAAIRELGGLLNRSVEVIRSGVPPVEAEPAILCLAVIGIGLVAVIVDILVAPGQAPAAAGLMLLCIYAVPASLADGLLPWWCFVLGAGSFALLLAVDRAYRQQAWRGARALGPAAGHDSIRTGAVVAGAAVLVALLAGTQVSMIGTDGRLPGGEDGDSASGPSQLGIKPFTTLRGMLDTSDEPTELFRVRGLGDEAPYLRSLTLQDYRPGQGWRVKEVMNPGVTAGETELLPPGPGDAGTGPRTEIRLESVNWQDVWLPVYNVPRRIEGVDSNWRYDSSSGIVYSQRARNPGRYTQQAMLAEPSPDQLRQAGTDYDGLNPVYTRIDGVDPRVSELGRRLTANADNNFDRAVALYRFFTATGGFSYDTQTAAATDSDALADFVLRGKTGFCEQYASAMAVMLRDLGVPARVAIGFTPGIQENGYRTITSQDAHAWVEVFFPGHGWMTFDPTPLSDGRGYTPDYLGDEQQGGGGQDRADAPAAPPPRTQPPPRGQDPGQQPDAAGGGQPAEPPPEASDGGAPPLVWFIVAFALLGLGLGGAALFTRNRTFAPGGIGDRLRRAAGPLAVLCLVTALLLAAGLVSWWLLAVPVAALLLATPAGLRRLGRQRRLRVVSEGTPGAADSAWAEVLAESLDRGVRIGDRETVRTAAAKLIQQHRLDDEGQRALRTLVRGVERIWYGGRTEPDPRLPDALGAVRASLTRNAPLGWRARLFPLSVVRTRETETSTGTGSAPGGGPAEGWPRTTT